MRFILFLLGICLAASLLSGCGAGAGSGGSAAPGEAGDDDYLYTIDLVMGDWMRPIRWTYDHDGNIVPEDEQYRLLEDVMTGEPQCRVVSKTEAVGGTDEYGNILTRELSALYDLDGNLLYDWAECVYYDGFGDFVIRQKKLVDMRAVDLPEDFVTELWNYKTGEPAIPGAAEVMKVTDGVALLGDFLFKPLGTVDSSAGKLSGFPAPAQYAYARAWENRIIASTRELFAEDDPENPLPPERHFLLTPDFEQILTAEYIFEGSAGTYFRFHNTDAEGNAVNGVVSSDGLEILKCAPEEYPEYHDDEIAVIMRGDYGDEENPPRFRLIRLSDGETLSGDGYEIFMSEDVYNGNMGIDKPTDYFLAYREDTLEVIGRDGTILASRIIPGVEYLDIFGPGLFRVSADGEGGGTGALRDALLDAELNDIIPAGKYNSLMRDGGYTRNYDYVYQDLMLGYKNAADGVTLIDVMDLGGNILIKDVNQVFNSGPNRLAVRVGFEAGLMDWNGNWIVRRSIFSDTLND